MDSFLSQLQTQGKVDSQGHFTLNTARARSLLARFQLPSPEAYVRNLVNWAAACGANTVQVRLDRTLTLNHDGRVPAREELADLFGSLLRPGADPALRQLAIGVNGAISLFHGPYVTLSTVDGTHMLATRRGLQVARKSAPELPPGVSVRLVVRERSLMPFPAGQERARRAREAALLKRECTLAPLSLVVNGQEVRAPDPLAGCAVRRWLASAARPGPPWPLSPEVKVQDAPGDFAALLGLGSQTEEPWGATVWYAVSIPLIGIPFPGARVVLYTDALEMDLSQTRLVMNAVWETVLLHLNRTLREMWEHDLPWPRVRVAETRSPDSDPQPDAPKESQARTAWGDAYAPYHALGARRPNASGPPVGPLAPNLLAPTLQHPVNKLSQSVTSRQPL